MGQFYSMSFLCSSFVGQSSRKGRHRILVAGRPADLSGTCHCAGHGRLWLHRCQELGRMHDLTPVSVPDEFVCDRGQPPGLRHPRGLFGLPVICVDLWLLLWRLRVLAQNVLLREGASAQLQPGLGIHSDRPVGATFGRRALGW